MKVTTENRGESEIGRGSPNLVFRSLFLLFSNFLLTSSFRLMVWRDLPEIFFYDRKMPAKMLTINISDFIDLDMDTDKIVKSMIIVIFTLFFYDCMCLH